MIVAAALAFIVAESTSPAAVVIAVVGAGGIVGGIVALLKVRPESGKLIVEAAEGAVVVQAGVITELRNELTNLRQRAADADKRELELESTVEELRGALERCNLELASAKDAISVLRQRLKHAGINGEDLDGIAVE